MGLFDDDDDDELNDGGNGNDVASLRRAYNKSQKQNKELLKQLSDQADSIRTRTVKDVIQAKGLNPKIAAFLPKDIGTDELAITTWLTEFGDVFAPPAASGDAGVKTPPPGSEGQGALPPDALAAQQIAAMQAAGIPVNVQDPVQMLAAIAAAKSPEDLSRLLGNNVPVRTAL